VQLEPVMQVEMLTTVPTGCCHPYLQLSFEGPSTFLERGLVGAEMVTKAVGAVPVPIELERGENCSGWTGELGCKGDDVINGVTLLLDEAA